MSHSYLDLTPLALLASDTSTGVELFIGSTVLCMFGFEICTPEGRGGNEEGNANFKTNHTEPLTQELTSPLYCWAVAWLDT